MFLYQRTFSDDEEMILKNYLEDIKVWVDGMIAGKINQSRDRHANEYRQKLVANGVVEIPASNDDLVKISFADPGYKNKKERMEEIQIENLKRSK